LRDLVASSNTSVLLITHNLGVVAQICSHVAVMYAGHIVESGRTAEVLGSPAHPYSQALLAALPKAGVARGQLANLPGRVPSLVHAPPGCRFAPRCSRAVAQCTAQMPPSAQLSDSHQAACIRLDAEVAA
jgi:peptide/nickel transport system ATP-binding protein